MRTKQLFNSHCWSLFILIFCFNMQYVYALTTLIPLHGITNFSTHRLAAKKVDFIKSTVRVCREKMEYFHSFIHFLSKTAREHKWK